MKNVIPYIIYASIVCFFTRCSDERVKTDPTAGLVMINEGYALGAAVKVELWAREELFTGFNNLYVALYDSADGERINEGHIHFVPTMTMDGGMQHSCPVSNPEDEDAVDELFPGKAMFIMPTSAMDSWTMQVSVHNHHNGKFGKAIFPVEVTNPASARVKSFVTEAGRKIFVSYNFPQTKRVGVNDVALAVYEMVSASEFVAVTDYQISLQPEMPAMEHDSPNNVNPVLGDDGLYHGKVNFTMTGDWRLHFGLSTPAETSQSLDFDVTL
jgi:hypothetical protein